MKALTFKLSVGTAACLMAGLAMAGVGGGPPTRLPIEEGGLLTVAIVALVAGIRIIQRKNKR